MVRTRRLVQRQDLYHLLVVLVIATVGLTGSYKLKNWIARRLGGLSYLLSRRKRRALVDAVRTALGEESPGNPPERIVRGALDSTWETFFSWVPDDSEDPGVATIEGLENLEMALAKGNGAILWDSWTFGCRMPMRRVLRREMGPYLQVRDQAYLGGLSNRDLEFTAVRAFVRRYFDRLELQAADELVDISVSGSLPATRTILDRVKANGIVMVTGDGERGRQFVEVPFFQQTRHLATGMANLALRQKTHLLPVFAARRFQGMIVRIEPAIQIDLSHGRDAAIRSILYQYAACLEDWTRNFPEQYRNWDRLCPQAMTEVQRCGRQSQDG